MDLVGAKKSNKIFTSRRWGNGVYVIPTPSGNHEILHRNSRGEVIMRKPFEPTTIDHRAKDFEEYEP